MPSTKRNEASCGAESVGASQGGSAQTSMPGRSCVVGKGSFPWPVIPTAGPAAAGSGHGMQPGPGAGEAAQESHSGTRIQGVSWRGRWVTALPFSHFFPHFSVHPKLEKTGTTLFFHDFSVSFNWFGKNCDISSTTMFSSGRRRLL